MSVEIAVIGGGAAGMMAACAAAGAGGRVTVFERNPACGVKLNLTGKGRCNVTNDSDLDGLIANTVCNGKFLYSAFSAMMPNDVIAFFDALGVPMKTERGDRVFPVSDNAKDISGALRTAMKRRSVAVVRSRVRELVARDGQVVGLVDEAGEVRRADRVILATGGLSYPRTGSSGDGYTMARALGHTVTETRPSLVPLVADGTLCRRLEGLSLRNVAIEITRDSKILYRDFGEMLFTADGVSGPLILSASAHMKPTDFPAAMTIDLKPALDTETLDRRVLRDFAEGTNRDFSNSLGKLLPAKLIPLVVEQSGVAAGQKVNSVTRAQREALCQVLKGFQLTLIGLGSYEEAVVTRGGVPVAEVNPKTMESRKVRGLYLAGELLDVDGYTGGFNLQIAWSTGHLAGLSAAEQ